EAGSRVPNATPQLGVFAAVVLTWSSEQPKSPHGDVAGAGVPKLNCTGGGFSAPGCAAKNGLGGKPSMPAIKFVGKPGTATLCFCTVWLKLPRSTEIRFSVPSNCACRLRKF